MTEINDGGSAFPIWGSYLNAGMSLRDYIAAHVINGIFAGGGSGDIPDTQLARGAYGIADVMLEARQPKEAPEKLVEMLEQYRNGEREMPTYAELIALVQP